MSTIDMKDYDAAVARIRELEDKFDKLKVDSRFNITALETDIRLTREAWRESLAERNSAEAERDKALTEVIRMKIALKSAKEDGWHEGQADTLKHISAEQERLRGETFYADDEVILTRISRGEAYAYRSENHGPEKK